MMELIIMQKRKSEYSEHMLEHEVIFEATDASELTAIIDTMIKYSPVGTIFTIRGKKEVVG